ncbi:hypothetical protein Q3G72_030812 [Acer saccharum]|nr:hypothetical protein Q3G72_030812 [Acer saccharum]
MTMTHSEGSEKKGKTEYEKKTMEALMGSRRRSRKAIFFFWSDRRGRLKGLKNKIRPEIRRMLGEATLHYGHARFKEVAADGSFVDSSRWLQAISVLTEVIMLNPCLPNTYHSLGLVYDTIGNAEKAAGFYELAAEISPRDSTLWKQLCAYFVNINKAERCLKKAVRADPSDITLRFHLASLYVQLGDYHRAAESYGEIVQLCPENVKALKTGTY